MMSRRVRIVGLMGLVLASLVGEASASGWKAGVAKVAITPRKPTWMAGYGARDRPSEGALHELWAKALVLADPAGQSAVLVSIDVCGIDRGVSRSIRDAISRTHQIP